MPRPDPHSYFDPKHPRVRHVRLCLDVDFDTHRLEGEARLELDRPSRGALDLDTKGLEIRGAVDDRGRPLRLDLQPEEPIYGRRLRLSLAEGTRWVTIRYATSPEALALQWLEPAQTASKRLPFLFSQCQAIHARSMAPLQDSPLARITYDAAIRVPEGATAVMSAGPAGDRPGAKPGTRLFLFHMPQPIPPYLLALAVGLLESRDLSPRARVWAEPNVVDSAAWEFADVEQMIETAERLFGPYDWERYDMIVLPPAFPYGGMENPRMTFLTPTLLAGDRSLVDVVAHELAHSWTGNLISNANADHFWLNEGFTVWAERRIVEAIYGERAAVVDWVCGGRDLEEEFRRFGAKSPYSRLITDLRGVDPDDVYSRVPYEKGARFLALIERKVGRQRFDAFVRAYIQQFRFTSITSQEFMNFLNRRLPGVAADVRSDEWLYGTGLPQNAPEFTSPELEDIIALAQAWNTGERPVPSEAGSWGARDLQIYLQHLPEQLSADSLAWLDKSFGLTERGNFEVLVEWLTIAVANDYEPAFARTRDLLVSMGRGKYLRPLYTAMGRHPRTRALAREIFAKAGAGYHNIARRMVEGIMGAYA